MMLVVLVTLMILFFSFQSLFTRMYSASYAGPDKGIATPVFSVCYGVFIAVASFLVGGLRFAPSWQTVLLGVINAGMLVLYNTSMIEAGNRGPYSFLMVCSMFGGILLPIAVGVCFLGETLSGLQIAAVALMLVSLVLMNLPSGSFRNVSRSYFVWCILLFLANGMYGVLLNLQAMVMDGAQRTEMLTILYLCSAVAAASIELAQGRGKALKAGFHMGRKAALFLLITCLSATAASNLLLYILTLMESSILFTIDSGAVLMVSILYSLVLFHEKPSWQRVVGMAIAVGSIVLINIPA